jgi:two-component system, OmpR family, sensor kinase
MLDSVRLRLTIWYTAVLALVLIVLAVLTYFLYWRSTSQRIDNNLVELADAFVTTFTAELPDQTGPDQVINAAREAMVEHRFRDNIFSLVDAKGIVLLSTLDLPAVGPVREQIAPEIFSSPTFEAMVQLADSSRRKFHAIPGGKDGFRGYVRPLSAVGQNNLLVVLQSLHPQQEILADIRNTFLWAIPAALLLASFGGYFLARKSLAPVAAMATQARGMGAANLHDRLRVANQRDEMGQLAISFNELLDRLEESFDRQKRFIADASHELRTPVAILRGETEVTLSRAERSPEEYRETLEILKDESRRLAHVVEDLFTLSRADAGQLPLAISRYYLDEQAADVLKHARSLALAKKITLNSSIAPELPIAADETLVRRMLLNLLDNAIKYTPEGGKVSLECRREGDEYVLSVSDSGSGIPAELQAKIFERFFRVDKARTRGDGDSAGAGLGLSIAKWIAEAHHGRLELTRSDSSGTTFTAYLPVQEVTSKALR